MCTTPTTTPNGVNTVLYAAALAAVKVETEAHSAFLDRAVSETRAALLTAARGAARHALPAGHVLQPLAELVADSLTVSEDRSNPLQILAPVVDLVRRVDGSSTHAVDGLHLWAIRPKVGAEERAYVMALDRRAGQAARLQGS